MKSKDNYLGGWHDREGVHDPVGVLLADLRDEQCSHTSSGTTTKRVGQLESLETVTALGFLTDNIENRVDQLSSLGVVSLGPVVSSSTLSKDKVVWTEELSKGAGSDGVHGSWLQIDKDGTGHIFAT